MIPACTDRYNLWPPKLFAAMNHDPNHKYGNSLSHTSQEVLSSVTTLRPSPHEGSVQDSLNPFLVWLLSQCALHM